MGKYTIHGEKVDEVIEKDIDRIKETILSEINPVSIILFGGFGKGEGSVEIRDNNIVPLNDYDLYVVTRKKMRDALIEDLGKKCSKAIGVGGLDFVEHPDEEYNKKKFFHVDLRQLNYYKLKNMLPTQRTFEIKKSSQIIWGENIFNKIPQVEISISDAIRLLFNKVDHLLLSQDKSEEIKKIYIMKSYLDLCSALLICKKDFSGFYKKRAELIKKYEFPQELVDKIQFYTKRRMNPAKYEIKDVEKEFLQAKKWVEFSLKYTLKIVLKTNEESWKDLSKLMYNKLPYIYFKDYLPTNLLFFTQYYLTIIYCKKCWREGEKIIKPLFSWKDVGIKLAIPLILYFYNEPVLAEKYLKKITNKTKLLKQRILMLYGSYYLQRLI